MAAAKKKHEENKKQEISDKKQIEPVVVSDVVTETTERVEVIEEVTPEAKPESDPLTDFKEKMNEEELPASNSVPQKNFMWPIFFVVVLVLISMIGIFLYKQGMSKTEEINVVTLTPSPIPSPTPISVVDLSKYTVKILNGSETTGEAGRQQDNLEGEGFTVSEVGNASSSDYTQTIIQAKANVDAGFLNKLKAVLEKSFAVGESEELSEDADSDVVVILGSETN